MCENDFVQGGAVSVLSQAVFVDCVVICLRQYAPERNVDKGGEIMTEEEQRRETVLRKLRRTGRGETVCLADWEVKLLLGYIDDMKRKAEKQK